MLRSGSAAKTDAFSDPGKPSPGRNEAGTKWIKEKGRPENRE
jgi:hypothetical protein